MLTLTLPPDLPTGIQLLTCAFAAATLVCAIIAVFMLRSRLQKASAQQTVNPPTTGAADTGQALLTAEEVRELHRVRQVLQALLRLQVTSNAPHAEIRLRMLLTALDSPRLGALKVEAFELLRAEEAFAGGYQDRMAPSTRAALAQMGIKVEHLLEASTR